VNTIDLEGEPSAMKATENSVLAFLQNSPSCFLPRRTNELAKQGKLK